MTQDTRKDRRVKIVSLNVRYKSATVDEFIENHAHDVSRGGIFIKTTTPFPGGTLLKFEIRLVSDQAVIAGVGRVVWKREASTATAEHPAGMGVKFIKVDEPSKAVIDRLINTRSDAGKSYDESEGTDRTPRPSSETPVAEITPAPAQRTTMLGTNPPLQPAENGAEPLAVRAAPPRPQKQGMFPQDDFEKETYPKQEQTVMKQAAELLEEALREAGGSMEEVGSNPLFSATGSASRIPAHAVASATENKPEVAKANPTDSARLRSKSASGAGTELPATHAKTLLGGLSRAPAKRSSEPPRAPSESRRKASGKDDRPPASPRPLATRASTPANATRNAPSKMAILLGAAAVVALGLFLLRDTLFGESADKPTAEPAQTTPSAVTAVAPAPSSAPAASATPTPEMSPSAVATALAASESASAAPVASAAPSTPRVVAVDTPRAATTGAPPPAAPVSARVAPSPAPAATTTVAATPMPATSVESPAGGAPSAPAAPAPPSATAAPPTSPRAAPPPALPPRTAPPPKPADDNPY